MTTHQQYKPGRLTAEREADLRKRASTDVQDLLAEVDALRAELFDAHVKVSLFRDYFNLTRDALSEAHCWALKGSDETQAMWEKHRRSIEVKP